MEQIKPITCYTTIAMEGSPLDQEIQEMVKEGMLTKHENVFLILTMEQIDKSGMMIRRIQDFEKLIEDVKFRAFNEGYAKGEKQGKIPF